MSWLSQCNGVGVVMGMQISVMRFQSHKMSLNVLVIVSYLASIDNSVTIDCFFNPHMIGMPVSDTMWPDIECW